MSGPTKVLVIGSGKCTCGLYFSHVKIPSEDILDHRICRGPSMCQSTAAGYFESVMAIFFRETEDPLAGAEGLLYKNWPGKESLHYQCCIMANLLSALSHVISRPSLLFLIAAMSFRHV